MSKLSRAIIWYLSNIAMVAFLYYGLFQDIGWAKNVGLFLVCGGIVSWTIMYLSEDVKKQLYDKGRSAPQVVSIAFDMVCICMLAAAAYYFTAVLYILACSCENSIYNGE